MGRERLNKTIICPYCNACSSVDYSEADHPYATVKDGFKCRIDKVDGDVEVRIDGDKFKCQCKKCGFLF